MQQHEKTSLRYVFFRLYSNDELLDFLKEQLKNGLVLDHCKGNFFFFRRWQLQNARLCVISIPCSKPRVEDDDEVQEYLDIAKRKGWQLLCVGDYESLLPMRRRLYFYTCDDRAQPLEQDEAADFQNAYRAYHASLRSSVAWVLLAALGLVATVPFMLADGLNFAMPVLDAALLVSACAAMTLHLNRRTLYRSVTKKRRFPKTSVFACAAARASVCGAWALSLRVWCCCFFPDTMAKNAGEIKTVSPAFFYSALRKSKAHIRRMLFRLLRWKAANTKAPRI